MDSLLYGCESREWHRTISQCVKRANVVLVSFSPLYPGRIFNNSTQPTGRGHGYRSIRCARHPSGTHGMNCTQPACFSAALNPGDTTARATAVVVRQTYRDKLRQRRKFGINPASPAMLLLPVLMDVTGVCVCVFVCMRVFMVCVCVCARVCRARANAQTAYINTHTHSHTADEHACTVRENAIRYETSQPVITRNAHLVAASPIWWRR